MSSETLQWPDDHSPFLLAKSEREPVTSLFPILNPVSNESDNPTFQRLMLHALVYGGLGALLAGGWMIFQPNIIEQPISGFQGWFVTILRLVFPVGAITLGVVKWRDRVLDGSARFSQLFGVSLAIGMVFSVVVAGIAWYYATSINPGVLEEMVQAYAAQLRAGDMPEMEIAAETENARQSLTAGGFAMGTLLQFLFLSFLVGLIAAFVGRRRRSPM